MRAYQNRSKYARLINSIAGVVFLGTPLRATSTASIARWLVWLRGFMGKETSETFLRVLEEKESSLDSIVQDFADTSIMHGLRLRCFYETRETRIANAVRRGWIGNCLPKVMVRHTSISKKSIVYVRLIIM